MAKVLNGRNFFQKSHSKKIEGTPWNLGGIGVAEWTGVLLSDVLKRAGLKPTARDVMPVSLDEKKIQRPFSIEKALEEDTLLVYAMNGDILPIDHGFPIRVLVAGWVGIAHTKWVGSIRVSETPLFSEYNTKKYVLIGEDYPVSEDLKAKGVMGQILREQKVKSAFELPWDGEIATGKRLVRGRSWSGEGKITFVEVSLDDGKTWSKVSLREPNITKAWVRWDLEWDARPGRYGLRARATDDQGNTQPDKIPFNKEGYSHWAVVTHPIKVV
ncbi:molybdopterin-dependent oxidoreductase [Nostoc sp. XA010]|uniref:molybdopterin-dependent oxidoreductase n=1 Tax=Nostoc sp. XA010 TaxID=2780407 RepID=UPI001E4278DF|nr:molybdopterin-dependent oxidoreductase [Nostoc sp. XA010]MCC5659205.1 molybdopterin-dependent oxidoreductase [Nostoc sp. XA010]